MILPNARIIETDGRRDPMGLGCFSNFKQLFRLGKPGVTYSLEGQSPAYLPYVYVRPHGFTGTAVLTRQGLLLAVFSIEGRLKY